MLRLSGITARLFDKKGRRDATLQAKTGSRGDADAFHRMGQRYARGELGTLHVIYSRYQSISEQVPTEVQILPPDLSQLRQLGPTAPQRFHRQLTPSELLAGLVDEYAFISLYLIAAESFASEQASRLLAMDSSTRNTEKMLETLIDLERRERQADITREVLELIGARFAAG